MPSLRGLLDGQRLTASAAPFDGRRASLRALDATLGIGGLPQSATGQAALLTGRNVPGELGYHYGPKPDPAVARIIQDGSIFSWARAASKRAALLNAYPPLYFRGITSGKRLYSSIPLAVTSAGIPLFTRDDLSAGQALAADFTGRGWRSVLHMRDTPTLDEGAAGRKLAELASQYDLALFDFWASDYAGHRQDMRAAVDLLEALDTVLGGLLEVWPGKLDLVLLTSDHGNMEDLSTRRHTLARVPALLVGEPAPREAFLRGLKNIADIAGAIARFLGISRVPAGT